MRDYSKRFSELISKGLEIPITRQGGGFPDLVSQEFFHEWFSSSLNLLENVFGKDATFSERFRNCLIETCATRDELESARGILRGAASEYTGGYFKGLRREISEEFVVDLCLHAESLADDGHMESAAVLASAALEDCFKREVEEFGISTEGKTLTEYIGILKREGILSGASAKMASAFPKFRNAAMHADWEKINEPEIRTITAFIKNFSVNRTTSQL